MGNNIKLEALRIVPGFANGLAAPSLVAQLCIPSRPEYTLDPLVRELEAQVRSWSGFEHLDPIQSFLPAGDGGSPLALAEFLVRACSWLQASCGVFIACEGKAWRLAPEGVCLLAAPSHAATLPFARQIFLDLLGILSAAREPEKIAVADWGGLRANCERLRDITRSFPSNTAHLLMAARRLGVPMDHIAGLYHIFGQGARQVLMNSSMPGHESRFGGEIAKNKVATAAFLRQLGLPAPVQVTVASLQDASRKAEAIGYPVVLKPVDCDGGMGVFPALRTAEDIAGAWELCRRVSQHTILEKHVAGRDYRLLVAEGELIGAIERMPAQVIGDGHQSIVALLRAENYSRKTTPGRESLLMPLPEDAETIAVLASQGLELADTPAPGQVVRLRHVPNHAQGGSVAWRLEDVHPENMRLACLIADALRLHVAGIDLICQDIGAPWWEGDAVICEVNHQPSMGRPTQHDLFGKLLRKLLPDGWRIPHVVIVGDRNHVVGTINAMSGALAGRGLAVGQAHSGGAFIDGERLARNVGVYQGHRIIVQNPAVETALVGVTMPDDLSFGLASSVIDFVIPAAPGPSPGLLAFADDIARDFGGKVVSVRDALEAILSSGGSVDGQLPAKGVLLP